MSIWKIEVTQAEKGAQEQNQFIDNFGSLTYHKMDFKPRMDLTETSQTPVLQLEVQLPMVHGFSYVGFQPKKTTVGFHAC